MATDLGTLKYTLTLDDSGLSSGLNHAKSKVEETSNKISSDMKKVEDHAGNTGLSFGKLAGAVALGGIATNIASDAFGFMKEQISGVFEAANNWATAQAQLKAGIESTGGAAGVTAASATELAESIAKTTPISREAALTGEDMLLTFTSIGHDVFPQATQAVADMATRMNGGLVPSAQMLSNTSIQVGKALQDPIKGIAALHRVGVEFTDQQKDQIKTMVAAGNQAGAQKLILAELGREFGGSAAASLDTFAGKQEQMKNKMEDAKASIGEAIEKAILPFQSALANFVDSDRFKHWVDEAIKVVQRLSDDIVAAAKYYEEHKRVINDVAQVVIVLVSAFLLVAGALKAVAAAQEIWNAVMETNPILLAIMLIIALIILVVLHWKEISKVAVEVFDKVKSVVMGWVNGAKKDFDEFFGAIKRGWDAFAHGVEQVFTAIVNFLKPIAIVLLALILLPLVPAALFWRAFHEQIIGFFVAIWHFIENVVHIWLNLILWPVELALAVWHRFHDQIIGFFQNAIDVVRGVWGAIVGFFGGIMNSVVNAIKGPIGSFGSMLYNAGRDLINGLIHGLESMAGAVMDKVKSIGKGIENTAKSILKIFSPSQVFSDIGQNVSLGLAQGIQDASHHAINATVDMGSGVIGAGNDALSGGLTASNSTVNNNSPITVQNVNLTTKEAVHAFFGMSNRNNQLESMGIAPLAGTVGV